MMIEVPKFIYDDVPSESLGPLCALETTIFSHPADTISVLDLLDSPEPPASDLDLTFQAIKHVIDKRHDRYLDFDDATEAALESDPDHNKLVQACREARPTPVHHGYGGHIKEMKPNMTAESKQRAVSISRLRFFANRVIAAGADTLSVGQA